MSHIELPHALEDYFAFAETTATRNGRRFVISLPYFDGARLDRLQWWYHVSPEQERQLGEAALATVRAQATERFQRHIERWLQNTRQRLRGEEPIPRIDTVAPSLALPAADPEPVSAPAPPPAAAPAGAATVVAWPADKVANG